MRRIVLFLSLVFFLTGISPTDVKAEDGTARHIAGGEDTVEIVFAEIAANFHKHCVKVFIHGKSHEGAFPLNTTFANDIRNERATLIGGYWWDDRHVILEDPVLQDQFIREVEIGLPYTNMRYPARIVGRFVHLQAVLLEVLPGDGGILPQAFPLQFTDGDIEDAIVLGYGWLRGDWGVVADTGLTSAFITDDGMETVELKSKGVLVDDQGIPVGLAFGSRIILDEDMPYWTGRELPYTPCFTLADGEKARKDLEKKLAEGIVEARFRIRVKVDDEEDAFSLSLDPMALEGTSERSAAAMVVGEHHLLIPVSFPPELIARIEDITLIQQDGGRLSAQFVGALRDYMAIVVQTDEALPTRNLPTGFTLLNPLVVSEEAFLPEKKGNRYPVMQYLQRWRIDYNLDRRRQVVDYDRWVGTHRGYRGDPVALTFTNEQEGSLAFDVDNNLVAVALSPRLIQQSHVDPMSENPPLRTSAGFLPLDFLHRRFHESDVFDSAVRPVNEEDGRRLVDLGVEFQGLDKNTSELFHASRETRGGQIGLLVTYVYPDSLADEIGLKEHDILLRLFVDGKNEPMELRHSGFSYRGFYELDDMSMRALRRLFRFLPPPWGTREDVVSALLTASGIGRRITVEFLRESEAMQAEFTTRYTAADFQNVKKEKFPALGLTVKPVTYEVARYFRLSANFGVVVSHVEEGGRSSVGGIHRYLIITHVDGLPVSDIADFKEKVAAFERRQAASVELTVAEFGKTRLVKIE